tara:strand:+ start:3292 stop:5541 length:2250 start_codon:yes stop_codon:yes gene_type:complete
MSRYDKYGANDDRTLQDLDAGFVGFNNRLRPDQLQAGLLEKCENARLDRNGEWTVRLGTKSTSAPLAVGDTALTLPFDVFGDKTVAQANFSISGVEITFTSSSHGLSTGTVVFVSGLGTAGVDPNGSRRVTKVDDNNFKISVTGLTGKPTGDATIACAPLRDNVVNLVYGSCNFSDPNSENNDSYIILVANNKSVAVKTSDSSTTFDLNYPSGETVSNSVSVIQAFNKVIIFRKGDTAMELDLASNNITSSPSFSLASNGAFTQQSTVSVSDLDIVTKVATATVTSVSGLNTGQVLTVSSVGSSSGFSVNDTISISSIDTAANKFTFIADVADQDSKTITFVTRVSSNLGFVHMPAPEFGELHQGRLIVPFQFEQTGSSGSPTITSRKIFDELIASDILDSNTYDQIFASLRFNAGASDFTVGIKSFTEDSFLVFNKNSIHRVSNTTNISQISSQILTDEIGCLARDTITQVGKNIFFLSDNGVYSLEFFDEYNLRGTQTPLSEPIQSTMDRINPNISKNSVAAYFDNRYYIAVPLDSEDGTAAEFNNALLVYNFLTNQWESIDTINSSPPFEYTNLFVSGLGSSRGLYCVNTDGGIHQVDGNVSSFDAVNKQGKDTTITQIGVTSTTETDIQGLLKTRMYTYGDIGRKKFNSFDIQAESGDSSADFDIKIQTENIDIELTNEQASLGSASTYLGSTISESEDVAIRGRIGNIRAYGAQIQIQNTLGKPSIRSIKTSATQTFRSSNSVE